ncbi:hypothetical protein Ddye_027545 [Dipteronia dyeriana]|uniref:Reverse transcriptase zinc-binding domain-containing protein n=1 Tax=Dipteronia dyeriana TaxID=168575 RepID=A0AAD9WRJ4_9ROSI|nr:hypothetical protein Ddye_027545 [Dipteronia dyeriana]
MSPPVLGIEAKVSILITSSGNWDVKCLKHHLCNEYVDSILKIPTGSNRTADTMLWHYEGNGRYTVKSGYWLGYKLMEGPRTSNVNSSSQWWIFLWNLNVPLKVKIFIWKACFDWIPTAPNLARRRVPVRDRCPMCKKEFDSTLHALWKRKQLKDIRTDWRRMLVNNRGINGNFLDFILDLYQCLNMKDMALFCVSVWRIWYCRNVKIHGQHSCEISEVGTWCKNYLIEYQTSNENGNRISSGGNQLFETWIPPNQDHYKINCCSVFDGGKG